MKPIHRIAAVLAAALTVGASTPAPGTKSAAPVAKNPAPAGTHVHPGAPAKSGAPAREGTYTTIVGEVMDPACFLEAGSKSIGPGHFQCAVDCARSGQTLAIYDRANDRIYFVAGELPGRNPNDPLMPYIHKKVDVSGTVYHRADAWGIVITKVVPHREAPSPYDPASQVPK